MGQEFLSILASDVELSCRLQRETRQPGARAALRAAHDTMPEGNVYDLESVKSLKMAICKCFPHSFTKKPEKHRNTARPRVLSS